ncbi:MAG: hypothetical protein AB7F86_02185 [Bdellovibrionales bacterium]
MKVGHLSAIILCLTLVGVVACPKKGSNQQGGASLLDTTPPKNNDGTQHGGGGGASQSTPELVNQAIDKAISMALEPDWGKNIFVQFIQDGTYPAENSGDDDRIEVILSPKFIFPKKGDGQAQMEGAYESPMLKAFGKNKITRLPIGDCPRPPDEETADASVSGLTLNADICFSVGNLTKLPPSILLREVLALVFHEAAHMGGAKEPDAKKYQRVFTQYFAARFGDITVDDFNYKAEIAIGFANIRIKRALELAKQKPDSPAVFAAMGAILGAINSVPYMDDALQIEFKARPKHPELVENFWHRINLVSQQISASFEPPWELQMYTLVQYTGRIARPDEVVAKITEQALGMQCLFDNYKALETGALRKECMLKPLTAMDKYFMLPRRVSQKY